MRQNAFAAAGTPRKLTLPLPYGADDDPEHANTSTRPRCRGAATAGASGIPTAANTTVPRTLAGPCFHRDIRGDDPGTPERGAGLAERPVGRRSVQRRTVCG